MSNPEDPNDPVGYGHPPKEFRFKPGQSGNYAGRPKANNISLNERISNQLNTLAEACDSEERVVLTMKRVIVRRTIKAALEGDVRAAATALARARVHDPKDQPRIIVRYSEKRAGNRVESPEGDQRG